MDKWAIGVDLGGTKVEVGIVSNNGMLMSRLRIATPADKSPESIVKNIVATVSEICAKNPKLIPETIGIGVAGQVEKKGGSVVYAPNLEWHNVNLQQQLEQELHKPVAIINDVKAAAWGEWLYGGGVGYDNIVCIFVGTGIGGAIVSNGQMMEGCNNTAGEIGHMVLQMNGPLCHCGNKGCFEALAGGWAIARDAQLAVEKDNKAGKMLLNLVDGDITSVNAKTISTAAQSGDILANEIIDKLAEALIAGVTSVINMVGPCRVILGGGVMEGMPELIDKIEKGVKKYALKAAIANVSIVPAQLHNDSGVIGAAAFALHQLKNIKV